jgi:hypothetical protein
MSFTVNQQPPLLRTCQVLQRQNVSLRTAESNQEAIDKSHWKSARRGFDCRSWDFDLDQRSASFGIPRLSSTLLCFYIIVPYSLQTYCELSFSPSSLPISIMKWSELVTELGDLLGYPVNSLLQLMLGDLTFFSNQVFTFPYHADKSCCILRVWT